MKNKQLPVRWSENAENDLDNIFEYIKKDSEKQALKVIAKIRNITKGLNLMPEKHQKESNFEDKQRDIRYFPIQL